MVRDWANASGIDVNDRGDLFAPCKKPEVDDVTRAVVFQSERSAFSWGHHWQGQVLVEGPSSSKLSLTGAVTIASSQGSDFGKRASEVAAKLFADVS